MPPVRALAFTEPIEPLVPEAEAAPAAPSVPKFRFGDILSDPDFQRATPEYRLKVLQKHVPHFTQATPEQQSQELGALERLIAQGKIPTGGRVGLRSRISEWFDLQEGMPVGEQFQRIYGTLEALDKGRAKTLEEAVTVAKRERTGTGKDIYVGATGALGGVAGRLVAGPPGEIVGSAITTTLAEKTAPTVFEWAGGEPPDSVSWWEALKSGLVAGAASGVIEGLVGGAKRLLRPKPVEQVAGRMQAFRETGVTPKPTDVARSVPLAEWWRAMSQDPVGKRRIATLDDKQALQLNQFADDLIARTGTAAQRVRLGEATLDEVKRVRAATAGREDQLWTAIPNQTEPVSQSNFKRVARELHDRQMTLLPYQRDEGLMAFTEQILGSPDSIAWSIADNRRKALGREAGRPVLLAKTPQAEAKALWNGLMQDMEATAARVGPQMEQAFSAARDYSTQIRNVFVDSQVSQLLKEAPEDIYNKLKLRSGPTYVKNARAAIHDLDPSPSGMDLWRQIQGKMLDSLIGPETRKELGGRSYAMIRGLDLERRANEVGWDTLGELLAPDQVRALKNIIEVAKAVEAGERLSRTRGTSLTPGILAMKRLLTGAGAGVSAMMGNVPGAIASVAVGEVALPWSISRLVTSPALVRAISGEEGSRLVKMMRIGGMSREIANIAGRWAALAVEESQREVKPWSPTSAVGTVMERMAAVEEPVRSPTSR